MKLKSPAFEKALRRKVRAEIRRSPALKRERTRIGRQPRKASQIVVQLFASLLVLGFLAGTHARSPEFAAGLLACLGTAQLFHQAGRLRIGLFSDPALPIFDSLPLTSGQVFDHQWRRFTRETVGISCYFAVAYFGYGVYRGFGPAQWAGTFLIAGLQWLLIYAGSTLVLARGPGWQFERMLGLISILVVPLVVGAVVLREQFLSLVEPLVRALSWITPAGWLNSLLLHGVDRGDWPWFALVIPMALLGATLSRSRQCLLEMHRLREPVHFRWPMFTADEARNLPPQIAARLGVSTPILAGATEIEDAIRARHFLVEPAWPNAGLLERWVARWLSPRETVVAAFVYLHPPGWTAAWKAAVKTLMIVLPLSLLVARLGNGLSLAVFGVGSVIIAFRALPVSDLFWRGFHSSGAMGAPIHTFSPFGYGEIARVLFKAGAVRALASLPLLAILGAFGAWQNSEQADWGVRLGCNLALLYICLNPLLVALSFSGQTSDYKITGPNSFIFSTTFVPGILLVGLMTFVQFGILLLNKGLFPPLILPSIIGVLSYTLYRWHRFAYDRCWFDAMKLAR